MTEDEQLIWAVFMDACDEEMRATKPCFQCSESADFFIPGTVHRVGDIKVARTRHNLDGSCDECGHVNTPAESSELLERMAYMQWHFGLKIRGRFNRAENGKP